MPDDEKPQLTELQDRPPLSMKTTSALTALSLICGSSATLAAAKKNTHIDPLIDRPLMKACGIISVKVPASVLKASGPDADYVGLYTLQYETFDRMPVYRQYTWLCNKKALLSSGKAKTDDEEIGCKNLAHDKDPSFLYFDSLRKFWKLGPFLGSNQVDLIAASKVLSPDRAPVGGWQAAAASAADKHKMTLVKAPGVEVACKDNPAAAKNAGKTTKRVSKVLSAEEDSKCISWRKTGGCDPNGPRQHEQDKGCAVEIKSEWSGFCECASGLHHKVSCGHSTFTCDEACKVQFPLVLAQSGERVWTNQMARNLLTKRGDWFTKGTTKQWVDFDLGKTKILKALQLDLWGSNASPKDCRAQKSAGYDGPWTTVKKFQVAEGKRVFDLSLPASSSKARYWRLSFDTNWGASWGMGFNQVRFFTSAVIKEPQADPCNVHKDCNSCVYSVESTEMVQKNLYCGWCSSAALCMMGTPSDSKQVKCPGKWMWTTCSATDHCKKFDSCSACTSHLDCGWCKTSNSCAGGDCTDWASRSCGNKTLAAAQDAINGINAAKIDQIKQQIKVETQEQKKRTSLVIALGCVVGVLFLSLVGLNRWQRKQRKRRMDSMVEVGCQWDTEGQPIAGVELSSQNEAGAAGGYGGVENEGSSLIGK